MGEDIHQMTYLKSKKTGKYVNVRNLCDENPEYSSFHNFVPYRDYDVFSLFGSRRGSFAELRGGNYGMPDFLKGTYFDEYCMDAGYYGMRWFRLPDLEKSINEYLERMKDPSKYDEDHPCADEWRDVVEAASSSGDRTAMLDFYYNWITNMASLRSRLTIMLDYLQTARYTLVNEQFYSDRFDVDETVYLFYFDN